MRGWREVRSVLIVLFGILIGLFLGYFLDGSTETSSISKSITNIIPFKKQVVGFLPYWLTSKASMDYSGIITTLNYFSLTVGPQGHILQYTNPTEQDPGWYSLNSGKADDYLNGAKNKNISTSLTVFSGDEDSIDSILNDPTTSAQNLISDIGPIMKERNFSDLNLDIESVKEASASSQLAFTQFVKTIKKGLDDNHLGTLTIDVSPISFVKDYLIKPEQVTESIDYMVIMAYDFHNPGSFVTGAVSPLYGAGDIAEFDTNVTIEKALSIMPNKKIILGVPSYGYSWETINNTPRSAIIPGTAVIISNQTVEEKLSNCTNCSVYYDSVSKEAYVIYKDDKTGTYFQIFYPNKEAIKAKVDYVKTKNLGGMAIWAMGYEGTNLLTPISHAF